MFFLYTTGCSLTWNEIVIYESFVRNLWVFLIFVLDESHSVILENPSLTTDKVISKASHFLICIFFSCLLRTWPLEGAVLSDYNLSPVLAAGWQLCLAAGDPRYLLLSIKHRKGPPRLSECRRVLSNSFVALSVGGFLLLSWRIAMNYCAPRREVFNREGSEFTEWLLSVWNCCECSAYISLFHPHSDSQAY